MHPSAIVGERGASLEWAARPTRLGSRVVVRSGTVIYAGAELGAGTVTGHGALIREDNLIGADCSIGSNAVLEPGNRIGDATRIHSGSFLAHVTLGARVFVGPNVVFTDDPHPACPRYLECVLGATVEDDVSIGANSTILPGVRIGAGSLIGAGSVVVSDVPDGSVVAGNPARVVKRVAELECPYGLFARPYDWREEQAAVRG